MNILRSTFYGVGLLTCGFAIVTTYRISRKLVPVLDDMKRMLPLVEQKLEDVTPALQELQNASATLSSVCHQIETAAGVVGVAGRFFKRNEK